MRRFGTVMLWLVGIFLIGRSIVEPFVIDFSDPASYAADWGGPHLYGVLAVHMLPGLVAAAVLVLTVSRRRGLGRPK